jgi:putative oxidoreductase
MNPVLTSAIALLARLLLAAMFLHAGYGKIGGFAGTVAYVGSKGLPLAELFAAAALALELIGGLLLVIGWKARWAAFVLAVFTVTASVLFHNFWAAAPAQLMTQQLFFLKNMAVAGGLLMVVAFGPGRWSVDRH